MRTDTRRGMKGDWKNEQLSTVLFGDFYFSHDLCGHYVRENTSYDLCSCRRRRYDFTLVSLRRSMAITEFIDFNTLGLLTGMMILISV